MHFGARFLDAPPPKKTPDYKILKILVLFSSAKIKTLHVYFLVQYISMDTISAGIHTSYRKNILLTSSVTVYC